MTTATPTPLTAFRTGRDAFLTTAMSVVNGLEESVLAFELGLQQRISAAESQAAELGRVNAGLLADLGEAREALAERTGAPAAPADETELSEARETIRILREELDGRNQAELSRPEHMGEDAEAAVDVEALQRDVAAALVTIDDQARDAGEAKQASEAELAAAKASWQADRASISDSNARLSEEILASRQNLEEQLAAGRTAATAEAVRVLAAVAADSPEVPLSEAMDLVVIAMDLPADFEPQAPEAADRTPSVQVLDDGFFDALPAPTVEQDTETKDDLGDEPVAFSPVFDMDTAREQLVLDEPAPEAGETPKPGFSLFGKSSKA